MRKNDVNNSCRLILMLMIVGVMIPNFCFSQKNQSIIAVPDFINKSPVSSSEIKLLQLGLPEMMIPAFSQFEFLTIVDRRRLTALLDELALDMSDMLDNNAARKVGQMVGADYVVQGSLLMEHEDEIRIDCTILKMETGETIEIEDISGRVTDILKLLTVLENNLIKSLAHEFPFENSATIQQLKHSVSYDIMMDFFRALSLIDYKQYRDADRLLTNIIERCPDFERPKLLKKEIRIASKRIVNGN